MASRRRWPRELDGWLTGPPVVAHRGFSGKAPENTVAAFREAMALGVMVELDVCLAGTGEVVILHDDTLDRTTSGSGKVADTPLSAIRELDAGSWFSEAFRNERVPTLDEALAAVGGQVVVDIELKPIDAKAELARGVVEAIRRAGMTERVFVSSFDPFLLEHVRRLAPEIRRAQLVGSFEGTDLAWYVKLVLRNLWLNHRSQPDLVIGGDEIVTERWVRRRKRRGLGIMVYTVNDPARMRQLRDWGVDAIITDHPDIALEALSPEGYGPGRQETT